MNLHKARDAAWREFGRRYWRAIIGMEIARRSLPIVLACSLLALVGVGVWWLVAHRPHPHLSAPEVALPPWWVWLLVGGGLLAAVAWRAWRWWNPGASASPRSGRRIVAATLTALGLLIAAMLWRQG